MFRSKRMPFQLRHSLESADDTRDVTWTVSIGVHPRPPMSAHVYGCVRYLSCRSRRGYSRLLPQTTLDRMSQGDAVTASLGQPRQRGGCAFANYSEVAPDGVGADKRVGIPRIAKPQCIELFQSPVMGCMTGQIDIGTFPRRDVPKPPG